MKKKISELEKLSDLTTSQLLDFLHHEEVKEDVTLEIDQKGSIQEKSEVIDAITEELSKRQPFSTIDCMLYSDEFGLSTRIDQLESELKEIKKLLKHHDHKDGKVLVRL